MDKIQFGMISSTYDLIESVSFLILGYLPYSWDLSARLGTQFFHWDETSHEIKITLIFLAITTLVSTVTALPFELVCKLHCFFFVIFIFSFSYITMDCFFFSFTPSLLDLCISIQPLA